MNEQVPASLINSELKQEVLFPIREVARLTGVNPVTLRAWERRYGLLQPTRTESGHRLYSQADIDDIRSILGWLERGVAVSKVGGILVRAHALKAGAEIFAGPEEKARWQSLVRQAVHGFDTGRLDQLYGQVFACYPLVGVFEGVFMPVWQELRSCREGFGQTSEWLFLDHFLRARVLQRLHLAHETQAGRVLLAPLDGHSLELELLVAGLLLGGGEIAVTVLACGQPLEELALVCERLAPQALVLFSNRQPTLDQSKRLIRLAPVLTCPLLLAGEAAELARESLAGTQVACLGAGGKQMRRCLAGHLDT
ncbi:MerR family transcriptional regulator [Pseudomonas sp. X10]